MHYLFPDNGSQLETSAASGETNTIIWLVIHGDRQTLPLEHGTAENLWRKINFKQICFQFCTKGVYCFRCHHNRELVQTCWRIHKDSTFANMQPIP